MRHRSRDGPRHRNQRSSQGGMTLAIVSVMVALGPLWGKEATTAFVGPAMDRLSEQLTVTPGSITLASTQPSSANSFPWTTTIKHAQAGVRATDVFCAFALFAGACSVRKMASRSASQHKHRSCTVACQAADVPMPVIQPRIPVVEETTPSPATVATPIVMQQCMSLLACTTTPQMMLESQPQYDCLAAPPMAAQVTEPRTAARPATMVGGARCTKTSRSAARHAMRRKAADRAAASQAARRAVGSHLQAASCRDEVPSLPFDASRQRLKIQAGLCLANRVRYGHMRELRSPAGIAEKSNGLFTTCFGMSGDSAYSTQLGICYCASTWPPGVHHPCMTDDTHQGGD